MDLCQSRHQLDNLTCTTIDGASFVFYGFSIYIIYIYILGVPLLEHRKAGRPPPPFHKTFRMFGGPEFHRPPAGMFGDEKSVILLLKFAAARNGLGTSQIWTIREKGDPKWRCRGFRVVPCRGSRCWGHGGHVHLHPEK